MNKKLTKAIFATMFVLCAICNLSYAQFNTTGTVPTDKYGKINDPPGATFDVRRVGLGYFTNTNPPASAFHINANLLTPVLTTAPNTFLPGEVFRTTGPSSNINAWRMFTGTGAGTEKFSIRNFPVAPGFNGNEVSISGLAAESEILFQQAQINMIVRNKILGIFSENFGAVPDDVIFGDGTDVNTTIRATAGRFLFVQGSTGNVGISTANPQSLLHINDGANATYTQITNTATGSTAGDGFKIGIAATGGVAELRQQENARVNFFTSDSVRVTVFPIIVTSPLARGGGMGIHLNPLAPITTPRALVHIGENIGGGGVGGGNRNWMQVGTFYGFRSDNMYVGIKAENNTPGNQQNDAVISWADDLGTNTQDNMRFIFTTGSGNAGTNPKAASANGQEMMRLTPTGRVGIGDFSLQNTPQNQNTATTAPNSPYIGATLDIDGDLRIRNVLQKNTLNQVLVRDPAELGRVYWRDAGSFIDANNGTSLSTINSQAVVLGQDIGQAGDPGRLISNREIPLNGNNLTFTGAPDTYPGKIGIATGTGAQALRTTPISLQVNGSISIFDGNGNTSLFFGEEQFAANSGTLGEWGVQYQGGGLNFWKPFGSHGVGFGNNFLFLSDNGNVGISASNPVNRTEITSGVAATTLNPIGASGRTRSGLRFTNLNATMPVDAPTNSSSTVLSVNNDGDLILVAGGGGIGNFCTAPQNPLTANFEVPLNNRNYYFTDPTGTLNDGINFVKIGDLCSAPVIAKLQIHRGLTTNTQFRNTASLAINEDIAQSFAYAGYGYGFYGQSIGANRVNAGIVGSATKGHANIGGYFTVNATYVPNIANFGNYGVQCSAVNGNTNYGISTSAQGGTTNNYGIYAHSPISPINYAGYFNGRVSINGTISSSGGAWASDRMFKTNINTLQNTLATINQLTPKSFYFDTLNTNGFNLPSEKQYGFIAQDVETVLPELVISTTKPADYDTLGNVVHPAITYKSLNYNAFIGILAKGIQELDSSLTSVSNKGVITSGTPLVNSLTKFTDSTTIANSQITDNGTNVGINTSIPNNKLEINSGIANTSGLTFTNLALSSTAAPSNGKVLSVDAAGKVILTDGALTAWSRTGNAGTTASTAAIGSTVNNNFIGTTDAKDWVMATNNIERARITSAGNVGIGTATPATKLDVRNNVAYRGVVEATPSYSAGAMFNAFRAMPADGTVVDKSGLYMGALQADNAAISSNTVYRNSGFWQSAGTTASIISFGTGDINFSTNNGLTANTDYSPTTRMSIKATGNVGIGTTSPTHTLEVTGSTGFYLNGPFGGTGADTYASDQLIKTNIDSIHTALHTIKQLKPKTFYYDTTNVYGLNFSNKKNYGFIAQDIETILPELVSSTTKNADVDTSGNIVHPAVTYKSLNYNAFIGILTKGIQEQSNVIDSLTTKILDQDSVNTTQQQINDSLMQGLLVGKTKANNQDSIITSLQNQLNQLASLIDGCCNSNGNDHGNGHNNNSIQSGTNNNKSMSTPLLTDVELSNKNVVVLNQNVPNPFAEQTTITYYLPDNVTRAQIIFTEQSGKIIKAVDITERGKGQLNVFANDLTNGIYTYSLVVDGQTMETKKMVKQ